MNVKRKNYKEDMKILVNLGNDYNGQEFQMVFTTGSNTAQYICSHFGENYKNCIKVDNKNILCLFDNHNLRPGILNAELTVFLVDSTMPDGNYRKVSQGVVVATLDDGKQYNIELISGNSDKFGTGSVTLNVLSDVIKGKDADNCGFSIVNGVLCQTFKTQE